MSSLVPIPTPTLIFNVTRRKGGRSGQFGEFRMMSHGRGLNWSGRGLDFLVTSALAAHACTRVCASATVQVHGQSNRPPDLPCWHFCDLPELNRRHCQKMNEDASGSRRRLLLAKLDFYFRWYVWYDTCMNILSYMACTRHIWIIPVQQICSCKYHTYLTRNKIQHSQKRPSQTPWSIFIH